MAMSAAITMMRRGSDILLFTCVQTPHRELFRLLAELLARNIANMEPNALRHYRYWLRIASSSVITAAEEAMVFADRHFNEGYRMLEGRNIVQQGELLSEMNNPVAERICIRKALLRSTEVRNYRLLYDLISRI